MLLLDAINEVLPKLGEHPVTSTEAKSPTLAVVIPQINATSRNLLTRGWWFNTFDATLYPDSEQFIDVPLNTLKWIPEPDVSCIVRGERFYNGKTRTFKFTEPVHGVITQDVPFEELPESVAQTVLYGALVIVYATDIGLENVVQIWQGLAGTAMSLMEAEHLQNQRYSIRKSRRYLKLRSAMRA